MPLFFKHPIIKYPVIVLLFTCCCITNSYSQKYIFSHYNIEDGLIQSQVNKLTQDASHRLWMGTLGGACCFDGRDFTSCSRENGLSSNFIYTVYCDTQNRMWLGSQMGLARLDGKKLFNYPSPPNLKRTWVTNITQDKSGTIWLTIENKLFKAVGNTLQYVPIPGTEGYSIVNILTDPAGNICVSVYQKGVYCLKNSNWVNIIPFAGAWQNMPIRRILFDRREPNKVYLLTYNKLFIATGNIIASYPNAELNKVETPLISLAQDKLGNLWIGSQSGAYYINGGKLIHFAGNNGFSDMSVPDIFCDRDNNIWLATWGGGIYKYEGSAYTVFDQASGLPNFQTVMGVAADKKNHIYLACDGAGLIQFDGTKFNTINLPTKNPYSKKVQCIYTDRDDNIWLGTSLGGLWKYKGSTCQMIPGSDTRIANALAQGSDGTMWVAAPLGCLYYNKNMLTRLDGLNDFCSSLLPLKNDSILIGTQHGLRLAVNKKLVPGFNLPLLQSSSVFCMIKYRDLILIGTADQGLFIWDPQNPYRKKL